MAAGELDGWKPIEDIEEIPLPSTETLSFPPVIVLDIETTSLDTKNGEVIAVGLLFGNRDGVTVQVKDGSNEKSLLQWLFDVLKNFKPHAGGKEIILTGYNLLDFDLPFLIRRAEKHNINPPFRFLKDKETGGSCFVRVAATEGTVKGEPLSYPAITTDLPIKIVDTLHLVCKWDYVTKILRRYDLKSVAAELGVAVEGRPILSHEEIQQAYVGNRELLCEYLKADLQETLAVFRKLIPPYLAIAELTKLPLDQIVTRSTAWVWEQILRRYYNHEPEADKKVKYEGALTASRKGFGSPASSWMLQAFIQPSCLPIVSIHAKTQSKWR